MLGLRRTNKKVEKPPPPPESLFVARMVLLDPDGNEVANEPVYKRMFAGDLLECTFEAVATDADGSTSLNA